jgi:predicted AlkP superfamily pyrophosphatase or phosphodiesterase
VFTLVESERPDLNTFVVADWLPLVADDAGGPLIGPSVDRKVALDGYQKGWSVADSLSVEAALQELGTGDPDLLFVYAGAPDEISHESGGIGTEYREAIAAADGQLGRLLEGIQSRPSFPDEDWLVVVTTDHGRTASGGHGGDTPEETTVFLLVSGPSAGTGTPAEPPMVVDIVVTSLSHLGIPARPEWELDGAVVGLRK